MVGSKNWCDWVYDIEPTATGSRVTHSWIDHRSKIASTLGKWVSGVADRAAHNKANMEVTMDNLAKAAEASKPAKSLMHLAQLGQLSTSVASYGGYF
jgi:hypothetical protein